MPPAIGGMVGSLIHIRIVTPVIFAWVRERELKRPEAEQEEKLALST